jgi:uncharacterized protein (PEP-CTERM system associated)
VAGVEERRGAGRGRSRSAGDHRGAAGFGVTVALIALAGAPAAWAQSLPGPSASPPSGGGGSSAGTTPGPQGGGSSTGTTPETGANAPATGAPSIAPGAAAARGPAWTFLPTITVNEEFTDNVFNTTSHRQSDLISTLSPGLFITGDSARLQGVFNYSPSLIKYATDTSQDQIQQNLFTNGTLTAVPNLFFFDGNASISDQSRLGGRGFGNTSQIPTTQSTQTIAYSGSPYLQFHFGDLGDAELRYSLSQTNFSGNTGPVVDNLTGQNFGPLANATQHAGLFTYNTGEAFSRLQLTFQSSYTQFISGNGDLNSRHVLGTLNASYAVTNIWTALFGGGYEKLSYSHLSNEDFSGPNWNVGARYQPRDDRQVTLTYGESEGQDTFAGSMRYAVTGDATLSASYTQESVSQQQEILQNLAASTQRAPGLTINPTTGLPQTITNPNLALQNGVFRARNLQAGLAVDRERNHYQVLFSRSEQDSLSAGAASQTTNGGIVSWSRDLTPKANGVVSAGYSSTETTGAAVAANSTSSTTDSLTVGVSVNYALTDTLTAGANYALSRQTGQGTGAVLVDIVSVSLRKTF